MESREELRSLAVVGGQWGDEGKGKIVDLVSPGFDAVVRYNGGHNAGHTVRVGDRRFALHLVPSGIVNPDTWCAMGAAMVVDPEALVREIEGLEAQGVTVEGRLFLSERAALILPTHRALDLARERSRGREKIGTTGRGIGPAYEDVAKRRSPRAYLLADRKALAREAAALMEEHNRELERLPGGEPVDVDEALAALLPAADRLASMLDDVGLRLQKLAAGGGTILFEGAQGVLLDVYHGTYPFVTSSSCLPAVAAVSCGVHPRFVGSALGVFKAYETRVGAGPFPTELEDAVGERLRKLGAEFGTTTGRPRRCGWFDAVAARYVVRVAGIEAVALTKLDVLDGLERIRIAVAYRDEAGERLESVPADSRRYAGVQPVYEEMPGWSGHTAGVTREEDLPPAARDYVRKLEELLGIPVVMVSTGPHRRETLLRDASPLGAALRGILG